MTAPARELARAVEDLRAPYHALLMASSGITAAMSAETATVDGAYYLLEAVGKQLDAAITRLEALAAGSG